MDDTTLNVSPDKLNQAVTALENNQGDVLYTLGRIHVAHSELQNVWRGAAASSTATRWTTLNAKFTAHASQLETHAQHLRTAAQAFAGQDDANAAALSRYRLNL